MPVIIAHSEDCAQVRLGPYQPAPVVEGSTVVKSEWTECDCGGMFLDLDNSGNRPRLTPRPTGLEVD